MRQISFNARLTPEQNRLFLASSDQRTLSQVHEHDRSIEELCRPMPLMTPAIRRVAKQLLKQRLEDVGTCCAQPWEADNEAR